MEEKKIQMSQMPFQNLSMCQLSSKLIGKWISKEYKIEERDSEEEVIREARRILEINTNTNVNSK